jgi:hypothetical protein
MALTNKGFGKYREDRTYAQQNTTIPIVAFYGFGDIRENGYGGLNPPGHRATSERNPTPRASSLLLRTVQSFDGHEAIRSGVSSVQIQKQLGSASGSWTVQLIGKVDAFDNLQSNIGDIGKDWSEVLSDGDWCVIRAVKNGEYSTLMVGRIDTISVSIQAGGNGAVTVKTTVTGRDVGATYEDVPVYFNPHDDEHNNAGGIGIDKMLDGRAVFDGSPSVIASQILHLFTDGGTYGQKPTIPAGVFAAREVPFDDIVSTAGVGETKGSVYAANMMHIQSEGSVWDYASKFVVPQFNEMFIDIDYYTLYGDFSVATNTDEAARSTRFARLTIRERPFVNTTDKENSPWFSLLPVKINLAEIQSMNLTKGKNRINQISVLTNMLQGMDASAASLFPPVHDTSSAQRFGLRRMEQKTNHDFGVELEGSGRTVDTAELRNLLVSWNALNPYYYNGMITIPMIKPRIRIGQKIMITGGPTPAHSIVTSDDGVDPYDATLHCAGTMTFYVEGVQYMFSASSAETPSVSTQIMVSRGYPEDRRLSDITKLAGYFTSSDTVESASAEELPEEPNDGSWDEMLLDNPAMYDGYT